MLCVGTPDRRVEESSAQREEELLQASGRTERLRQPSQETSDGQVEEEELHSLDRRVAQLSQ